MYSYRIQGENLFLRQPHAFHRVIMGSGLVKHAYVFANQILEVSYLPIAYC